MSRNRTSRNRTSRTRLVGAASVALAALLLTACSDDSTKADGKAPASGANTAPGAPASPPATASASTPTAAAAASASASAGSGTSGGSAGSSGSAGSAGSPGSRPTASNPGSAATGSSSAGAGTTGSGTTGSGNAGSGDADSVDFVTCEGSNTKTVAAPLNRPVNHMLLTVTNTGSKLCALYGYPAVRFGDAQSVPPVIEDSKPQAVVMLQPGESGYASVNLSATDGSGTGGRTETSLTVYFQGRSLSESVGAGAHPSLPAKGTYVDSSLAVTYWQQSMDTALVW